MDQSFFRTGLRHITSKRATNSRTYLFGYRHDEVGLPRDYTVKKSFHYELLRQKTRHREYVKRSLGIHVDGAALPSPDPFDQYSQLQGAKKRFCCAVPRVHHDRKTEFRAFVRHWLHDNIRPLAPYTDTSVDGWLMHCNNYTQSRKDELRRLSDKSGHLMMDVQDFTNKMFTKREEYPSYKAARCINSRTDRFKIYSGPLFKKIEEELFAMPWFIKHVPVPDRPQFILDRLYQEGATYVATDYTSFEGLFDPEIQKICEMQLYRHMTKNIAGSDEWCDTIEEALTGTQTCMSRSLNITVKGARMSGDMCTSLGNGFTNLMLMLFLCHRKHSEVIGVVEGDDGLFRVTGTVPTAADFAELGFIIKIEECDKLNEASFCGLIFDVDVKDNLADPVERILGFGWTMSDQRYGDQKVLNSLLVAKAMSLMYELPGCPMLKNLGLMVLRILKGYRPKYGTHGGRRDWWELQCGFDDDLLRRDIAMFVGREIPQENRDIIANKFGVPEFRQREFEQWCDRQSVICPIPLELLEGLPGLNEDCKDYFNRFLVINDPAVRDHAVEW